MREFLQAFFHLVIVVGAYTEVVWRVVFVVVVLSSSLCCWD